MDDQYNKYGFNNDENKVNQPNQTSADNTENSYEWNGTEENKSDGGEYHYSYINGHNENASHNPNNYDNVYSAQNGTQNEAQNTADYQSASNSQYAQQPYDNTTANNSYNDYLQQPQYGNYSQQPYASSQYGNAAPHMKAKKVKKPKVKKPAKPITKRFLAAVIAITIIASAAIGFGGGYAANLISSSSNSSVNINKVTASGTSTNSTSTASTTSQIVKKTADSVVEIATEGVVTGNYAQQYVQKGAGSGVIISDDGYIVTNYHVIEGANTITVTLRDGKTNYTAAIIGSDEDNDIALLKIDAKKLSAVTFGDSSALTVGDYVVAIGNPLGELGGTVTDGIISALAREVKIENKQMTLLQTNAQISPGNSGGGLFNANGELVGIVNAKDSATEVEGIGFAIPTNNVLDIISDLKSYGYVTGKIDLGMQLTDITSNESAFYYGVNQTGCYVLSVTKGSNAEKAGFKTGDLLTKVNGTKVSSSAEVKSALSKAKVGDKATFTIYRNGKTTELSMTLAEYTPSSSNNSSSSGNSSNQTATSAANNSGNSDSNQNSDDSIWSQMFGW